MAISLGDNIKLSLGLPNDARYYSTVTNKPWTGVTEVNTQLTGGIGGVRYTGLTVNIGGTEYWYKDGIGDLDLVPKETGGGSGIGWSNLIDGNTVAGCGTAVSGGSLSWQYNTIYGVEAAPNLTTGDFNVAIGYRALCSNQTRAGNIAIGACALCGNTGGTANVAIGSYTLGKNIAGGTNIAIGQYALTDNINGGGNVAIGVNTLENNTGGTYNTGVGEKSLRNLVCGDNNTALGAFAGSNAFGCRNVFLGYYAGVNETGNNKLHIANCLTSTLICGDFTGKTVTIDNKLCVANLQIPTGAAAGCVLTSDASGNAIWEAPSGGGGSVNMSGSTVSGLTTYVDSDTICSQPNLTFNGSCLGVTGCLKTSCKIIVGGLSNEHASALYQGKIDTTINYGQYLLFRDEGDTVNFSIANGSVGSTFFPIFSSRVTSTNPAMYFVGNSVSGPSAGTGIVTFDGRVNNAGTTSSATTIVNFVSGYGSSRARIMGDGTFCANLAVCAPTIIGTAGITICNGADMKLVSSIGSNDTGDITFYSGSTANEWARIYSSTNGCLYYRNACDGLVARTVYHSGNLVAATPTVTGLMSSTDKSKLDGIAAGAQVNVATNLGYTTAVAQGTVTSSTGTNATIPVATTSLAGLMACADKVKLDGIAAGAQVNVATNLTTTHNTTTVVINSSTGTNATINAATASLAGIVTNTTQTFGGAKTTTIWCGTTCVQSTLLCATSSVITPTIQATTGAATGAILTSTSTGLGQWCAPIDVTTNLAQYDILCYDGSTIVGATDFRLKTGAARCIYFNQASTTTGSPLCIVGNQGATTSVGGAVCIFGGNGGVSSGTGGAVCICAGSANGSSGGGAVHISGGNGYGGGALYLCGGVGSSTQTGYVYIYAGLDQQAVFYPDSCVSLRYDAVEKFNTMSYGTYTTGNHCATTSVNTPTLCNVTTIRAGATAENGITLVANGCVSLYYDNSEKLKTVTNGICLNTYCGFGVDWVATSDCRLKTEIQPITSAMSVVNQLQGVCYKLCDDIKNENRIGLIAQDVEKILPEIVSHSQPSEEDFKYGICDDKLGLKYDKLTALLVEAIKEQQIQINNLVAEICELKG